LIMRKFLPFLLVLFSFIFLSVVFAFLPRTVAAQAPTPTPVADAVPPGDWRIDPEVTFIGKNAARSGNLLDFTLENYNWVCVKKAADGQCDNSNNPLTGVWLTTVTYIVVPLLFVVVLAAAIIIIVTRGRSITIMRFLPRFVAVLILIFLSFALLQFFYQFIDVIQGFFLRKDTQFVGGKTCPPECISQEDLLFVGWKYEDFIGLRLSGDENAESAFISLLLTKLTALTYYVMVGILTLRKIILWLFIIVSPIFPILLLFYPVRNTGKIWIGEFFRWLLYAPLFAIFLKGLVVLWREGIPLVFHTISRTDTSQIVYPTAVNILLGGPKEFVTPTNSINLTESFALYVFALLMLWGVIILPWILLQIFLDYASNLTASESPVLKSLVNRIGNQGPPGSPSPTPPSGGSTLNLPFAKKFTLPKPPSAPTGLAREIPVSTTKITQTSFMPSAQVKAQTLSLVDMQLPSIRDIAKYDSSLISSDKDRQRETLVVRQKLEKISNPALSTSTTEREHFSQIREKLEKESSSGNVLATSILNAANISNKKSAATTSTEIKKALTQIANPQAASAAGATSVINREKLSKMNESLVKAKKEGNTLAASILSVTDRTPVTEIEKLQEKILDAKAKGEPVAAQVADITAKQKVFLPAANRIQTVSKEDYEEVEKMWEENYKNMEVPAGMAGTRSEWVKDDISKIDGIVNLLTSSDQEKVAQGMDEVSSILPFLLVGGFSLTEIVSYLRAKQEAGKKTIAELAQEEEQKVEVSVKKTKAAEGHLAASVSESTERDEPEESPFEQPVDTSTVSAPSQTSNDLFALSNLKLPKLTDIVQYEVRHLTRDKTESERVEKIREVLERLTRPEAIASADERQQYEKLREKLSEESRRGDPAAGMILSAVSQLAHEAEKIDLTLSEIKIVLSQIVNPQTATSSEDRGYYTRLHEYLEKESRENNNTLATRMLSVNDATKEEEIREIKEQLAKPAVEGVAPSLPQVTQAIAELSKAKELKEVISSIISSDSSVSSSTQNITSLREGIREESGRGNSLASSIMAINQSTSETEVKKTYKSLINSAQTGDSFAKNVISQISVSSVDNLFQNEISNEEARNIFEKIANPETAPADERNYFSEVNQYLKKESQENNNQLAQSILTVNSSTSSGDIQNIKNQLVQSEKEGHNVLPQVTKSITEFVQIKKLKEISTGSQASGETAELHKKLTEEGRKGNPLASAILSINSNTPDSVVINTHRSLKEAVKKGDPFAKSFLSHISGKVELSATNRLQKVTPEEYEQARELWEKAYKQYLVPQGFTEDVKGRMEWIQKDSEDIEETINLLGSGDEEKKDEGMKKVSGILPFLLLGGFSYEEMLTYLKIKLEAARAALKAIQEEEENSVTVKAGTSEPTQKVKAREEEVEQGENK
jgi:hypothetical protein